MSVVELAEGVDSWSARAPTGRPAVEATRPLRLVLGVLSLLCFGVGSVAALVGADSVRLAALLFFCGVGVGAAPWQLLPRLRGYERLTLTFVTGISVMTLVPMALVAVDYWHPQMAFVVVAAAALPLHLLGLLLIWDEVRDDDAQAWPSPWFPLARTRAETRRLVGEGLPASATATAGALLCLVAALSHRHMDPGYYGFPARIGPLWDVGLALVLVGLALRGRPEHSRAIPVFLLGLVLTLTPALVYDGPRSQSAAKHIDFVHHIEAFGTLDSTVPVYNAYAGFFDAMAWLSSVTGMSESLAFATLWPALLGLFRVVVLRYLAGRFLATSAQCWVAVTLAVLADSIGGDYFSPQSVGLVLGMATIAIAVTRTPEVPRLPLVLLGGVTLAVSHQLSPYITGGVLVVLTVFRLCRPWWTPALVLVPAAAWSLAHWDAVRGHLALDAFGRQSNFAPPETFDAPLLERLPVVQHTVWAALVGIGVVAFLALASLVRHWRSPLYRTLACCPAVGVVIVVVQPYGEEGVFRAALFGIPWLAVMAAPLLTGDSVRSRTTFIVTSTCLAATFLVASFGLDTINVIRPSDYAAIRTFQELGGPNPPELHYLLLLNPGDHPTSPGVIGGRHSIWGRDMVEQPAREIEDYDPESEMMNLTSRLVRFTEDADADAQLYALWSPIGARYGEAYGIRSLDQSTALRDAFESAPYWSVEFHEDGTYMFHLDGDGFRAAAGG